MVTLFAPVASFQLLSTHYGRSKDIFFFRLATTTVTNPSSVNCHWATEKERRHCGIRSQIREIKGAAFYITVFPIFLLYINLFGLPPAPTVLTEDLKIEMLTRRLPFLLLMLFFSLCFHSVPWQENIPPPCNTASRHRRRGDPSSYRCFAFWWPPGCSCGSAPVGNRPLQSPPFYKRNLFFLLFSHLFYQNGDPPRWHRREMEQWNWPWWATLVRVSSSRSILTRDLTRSVVQKMLSKVEESWFISKDF